MAVSINKRLSTKKANKLPNDVKDYIINLGNNKKATSVLNFVYKYIKQNGSISIQAIEDAMSVVNSVYIPRNDNFPDKFELYSILMDNVMDADISELKRYASIPFGDPAYKPTLYDDDKYTRYILMYMSYKLMKYGIDDDTIAYIIDDHTEVSKINEANHYMTGCQSVWTAVLIQAGEYRLTTPAEFCKRITKSKLFLEMKQEHIHISGQFSLNPFKNMIAVFERYGIGDFEYDQYGYINPENKINRNYYENVANRFLAKHMEYDQNNDTYKYCDTKARGIDLSTTNTAVIFTQIPATEIKITINHDSTSLQIQHSNRTKSYVSDFSMLRVYTTDKIVADYTLFAYNKTEIYIKDAKYGSTRPLTLNDLVKISKCGKYVIDMIDEWMDMFAKENPFFYDFKRVFHDSMLYGHAIIPMSVSDVFKTHNWNQWFRTKYKEAKAINVNFNKLRLAPQIGYAAIKAYKYIVKSDLQTMIRIFKQNPQITIAKSKNKALEIIEQYYTETLNIHDHGRTYILHYWLDMQMKQKKLISLKRTSMKKIQKECKEFKLHEKLK